MAVLPKVAQGRRRDSPSLLAGALWKLFLGAVLDDGRGLSWHRPGTWGFPGCGSRWIWAGRCGR